MLTTSELVTDTASHWRQGARLVDIALEDGSAWSGDGFNHIKPSFADNTVHFIGLLSDGGATPCPNFLHRPNTKAGGSVDNPTDFHRRSLAFD